MKISLGKIADDLRRVVDLGQRGGRVWREAKSLHAEGVAARARVHRLRREVEGRPATTVTTHAEVAPKR